MTNPLPYDQLIQFRNAFVMTCTMRGLCDTADKVQECNDYFTKRATELGWIEKTDIKA